MDDKYYPKDQFEKDLEQIRGMNISMDSKVEKGEALAHIYYNQEKEWVIDHMAIGDMRDNILKE